MRASYDAQVDAFYLAVGEWPGAGQVAHQLVELTAPVSGVEINLDFDADGRLLGIECLNARAGVAADVLERAEQIG